MTREQAKLKAEKIVKLLNGNTMSEIQIILFEIRMLAESKAKI